MDIQSHKCVFVSVCVLSSMWCWGLDASENCLSAVDCEHFTHTLDYAMAGFVLTYNRWAFSLLVGTSQPTFRWLSLLTKAPEKHYKGSVKERCLLTREILHCEGFDSAFILFFSSNSFPYCRGLKYCSLIFNFWFLIIVLLCSPVIFKVCHWCYYF